MKTKLLGIVNVTPDSFSDGGISFTANDAIKHAITLQQDGASIIDIGAESTRPNATPLTAEEEWQRLKPVLDGLSPFTSSVSIDTRHPETARKCLELGVYWINDVTGLTNPEMIEIVQNTGCKCVVMHSLDVPANPQNTLPDTSPAIDQLCQWAEATLTRLGQSGITPDRIILDPGIGFGKTAEQSLSIIQHISKLKSLGTEILVGHSRKSCFGIFTDVPSAERDIETYAASLFLAQQAVDYLRVHTVKGHSRLLNVWNHLNLCS